MSQADGKWIGRSLLVPVAAGVLCAFVVDSVAVGGQGRAALTQIVKDPATMFAGRSPGERGDGAMYQTKHKAVGTPSERTLASVPAEPAQNMGLPVVGDAVDPIATALFAQPEAPPAEGDAPPEGSGLTAPLFTPQQVFPIIGGGIPGNSDTPVVPTDPDTPVDPNPPVDPVVPPPPAIPEPATWLSLIVGLFTTGAVLRYQRRVAASDLGAQPTL